MTTDPNNLLRDLHTALCGSTGRDVADFCLKLDRWLRQGGREPDWNRFPKAARYYDGRHDYPVEIIYRKPPRTNDAEINSTRTHVKAAADPSQWTSIDVRVFAWNTADVMAHEANDHGPFRWRMRAHPPAPPDPNADRLWAIEIEGKNVETSPPFRLRPDQLPQDPEHWKMISLDSLDR